MSKKIKILQFITLSEIGGAQTVLYRIIKHLPENFEITLICAKAGELVDMVKNLDKDINIVGIDELQRDLSFNLDSIVFKKVYSIIKQEQFDIVHCHSSKAGVIGRICGYLNKTPKIIFTSHGLSFNNHQGILKRSLYKTAEFISGKCCHNVVCVSEYDKNKLKSVVSKKKLIVIPNSVEQQSHPPSLSFLELRRGEKVKNQINILFVGRLSEPKLPELLIKCFVEFKNKNVKLQIVGDGPKFDLCKDLKNNFALQNIQLLGTQLDVKRFYSEADIFILLSRWEGLPMTIIEAMSFGLPVIASNVGGIPELIKNGYNGYLVDNKEKQIENCLNLLIQNQELRQYFAKNTLKKYKENYTIDNMIKQYLKIYLE